MEFPELIRLLSRQFSLPGLSAGQGGRCAVRFDDIVVHFSHVPEARAFDLSTALGRIDAADPRALQTLRSVREGNGHLHWNEAGAVWMAQRFFLQAMAFPNFVRALERFINQADHCRACCRPDSAH